MDSRRAAAMVAKALSWALNKASDPAIEQVSHDGTRVRFRERGATGDDGWFTMQVGKGVNPPKPEADLADRIRNILDIEGNAHVETDALAVSKLRDIRMLIDTVAPLPAPKRG